MNQCHVGISLSKEASLAGAEWPCRRLPKKVETGFITQSLLNFNLRKKERHWREVSMPTHLKYSGWRRENIELVV